MREFSKTISTPLLIVILAGSAEARKPANSLDDLPEHIKKIRPSVVEIFVDGVRNGTGVIVSSNGLILTATHVVGEPDITDQKHPAVKYKDKIEVVFSDGTRGSAEPIPNPSETAIFYDISLLRGSHSNVPALKISNAKRKDGQLVYLMGFPLDLPEAVTYWGTIASQYSVSVGTYNGQTILKKFIQVQAPIAKGFSGGPLLDFKTDEVIGIVDIKIGSINDRLVDIAKEIMRAGGRGGVRLSGIDTNEVFLNLIAVLDRFLSAGSGAAVSAEHISDFVKSRGQEK